MLITRLQGSTDTSLHLVVLSFDGYLYLVDAMTGLSFACVPHQLWQGT